MIIDVKKGKQKIFILSVILLICIISAIMIGIFVENKQAIPFILIAPVLCFVIISIFLISIIVKYIKNPHYFKIYFEDDYIVFSKDEVVYYKDIIFVQTDYDDFVRDFYLSDHNNIRINSFKNKKANEKLIELLRSKGLKVLDNAYRYRVNCNLANVE